MDFSYLCKVNTRERFYSLWCEAYFFLVGSHSWLELNCAWTLVRLNSLNNHPHQKKSVFSVVDAQTWDFILCLNISSRTQVGNYDGIHHTPFNFTYLKKKYYSLSLVNIMLKK